MKIFTYLDADCYIHKGHFVILLGGTAEYAECMRRASIALCHPPFSQNNLAVKMKGWTFDMHTATEERGDV